MESFTAATSLNYIAILACGASSRQNGHLIFNPKLISWRPNSMLQVAKKSLLKLAAQSAMFNPAIARSLFDI
jgi:hypothetical protein